MLYTDNQSRVQYAPVDKFHLMRDNILSGPRLAEVKALEASIERFGLQIPLSIIQRDRQLVVIDGRKRLAALRRLAFKSSQDKFLVAFKIHDPAQSKIRQTAGYVRSEALFEAVRDASHSGQKHEDIASGFDISIQCVRDILTIERAHPHIRQVFFAKALTFSQLSALISLPSFADQLSVFFKVDLHSSADQITEFVRRSVSVPDVAQRVAA